MNVLIVGCGYVGRSLGMRLMQEKHHVTGMVRSPESALAIQSLGMESMIADCSTVEGAEKAYGKGADIVIFCVSSKGGDYHQTYVQGIGNVLDVLKKRPPRMFFYTSSTSVYAQTDGGLVAESSPTEPLHENGKFLLEAENLLKNAAEKSFAAFALRLSGIYGPGRHAMLDRLRSGIKELSGDGKRWVNQIFLDDVVHSILYLIRCREWSPGFRVLNVSDDIPVLQQEYVEWLCKRYGFPVPKYSQDVSSNAGAVHRRGEANRRISNQALKDLGWRPEYPGYPQGFERIDITR